MSSAATPAIAMADLPASVDISVTVPSTWRVLMPVRSRIHSSEVSTILASSSLVSTFSGRCVAHPVIRPCGMWRCSVVKDVDRGIGAATRYRAAVPAGAGAKVGWTWLRNRSTITR